MTYAIGEIVYGVNLKSQSPWSGKADTATPEQRGAIYEAAERELVHTSYSGGGEMPMYVGPVISCIDECDDTEISELILTPTDEHIAQFKKEVDELVAEYPILDGLFDNPTVFITWGTS